MRLECQPQRLKSVENACQFFYTVSLNVPWKIIVEFRYAHMFNLHLKRVCQFLKVFLFDTAACQIFFVGAFFRVSQLPNGIIIFYQQGWACDDINHVAQKLHGIIWKNIQQLTQSDCEFFICYFVNVRFEFEEFYHGNKIIERFFRKSRTRLDEFIHAGFDFGVVDWINDGNFYRLGVVGQFQSVIGNINKFPVE